MPGEKIIPFPAYRGVTRDLWRTVMTSEWQSVASADILEATLSGEADPAFLLTDLHSVVSEHLTGIAASQWDRKLLSFTEE